MPKFAPSGRTVEHEEQYQRESAALSPEDRRLACLLSSIERNRSAIPMHEPIPIYEHMAYALRDPDLRRALVTALLGRVHE